MSTILVTGANGFIGSAVCVEAAARGFNVRGATRPDAKCPDAATPVFVADITSQDEWMRAAKDCDVVIHLAARVHVMTDSSADPMAAFRAINVVATERIARSAAANGVKRFVYVSSIKVNGESTVQGSCFVETDHPQPKDPYAISKFEAERAVQRVADDTGMEVVIVRPPLVYGAGVKGNFALMLRAITLRVPLPLGGVKNKRDMVFLGNLVDALICCANHPEAKNEVYLVCDGEPMSTPDLIRELAILNGRRPILVNFPVAVLWLLSRLFGVGPRADRLLGSLEVNSNKIQTQLGWEPPFSVRDGLTSVVL